MIIIVKRPLDLSEALMKRVAVIVKTYSDDDASHALSWVLKGILINYQLLNFSDLRNTSEKIGGTKKEPLTKGCEENCLETYRLSASEFTYQFYEAW